MPGTKSEKRWLGPLRKSPYGSRKYGMIGLYLTSDVVTSSFTGKPEISADTKSSVFGSSVVRAVPAGADRIIFPGLFCAFNGE